MPSFRTTLVAICIAMTVSSPASSRLWALGESDPATTLSLNCVDRDINKYAINYDWKERQIRVNQGKWYPAESIGEQYDGTQLQAHVSFIDENNTKAEIDITIGEMQNTQSGSYWHGSMLIKPTALGGISIDKKLDPFLCFVR